MAKFVWQDGTLVSKAKVEIGGTIYEVDPEEYSGSTPLSASNLNAMVDSTYSDLKDYADEKQTYSTDETKIGTWLGKPLYRKVIDFGTLPNNETKTAAHGLNLTICNIKKIEAYASSSSLAITCGYNDEYYLSSANVYWNTKANRTALTGYVILEYTKTTD